MNVPPIGCPHCGVVLTEKEVTAMWKRLIGARRKEAKGWPKGVPRGPAQRRKRKPPPLEELNAS